MTKTEKDALQKIEDQLYAINARNISMGWIALKHTPTREEISELNAMLGFIIHELRTLRETGKVDDLDVSKPGESRERVSPY